MSLITLVRGYIMPRPVKCRKVCRLPLSDHFGPLSDPKSLYISDKPGCQSTIMSVDEYETIRLIDLQGFTQEECAKQMNVARTTAQSMYAHARKKMADCLVNGKALRIKGGNVELCSGLEKTCRCGGCKRHKISNSLREGPD